MRGGGCKKSDASELVARSGIHDPGFMINTDERNPRLHTPQQLPMLITDYSLWKVWMRWST